MRTISTSAMAGVITSVSRAPSRVGVTAPYGSVDFNANFLLDESASSSRKVKVYPNDVQ